MLFSTVVFARSARAKEDNEFSAKVAQLLRLSLIAIGIVSVILFLFSHFIIISLFGKDFINSVNVLRVLLPGVIVLTFFKVMNMDMAGKGKPWVSMKAMIPALIMNILINILLIPSMGSLGASISSTVSYTLAAVLFVHFYSIQTKISVKTIFAYKRKDFDPLLKIIKKRKF